MTDYPIKIPQQLGPILQGYRRVQKLTQKAVGMKAGLPQNAISQLEADPGRASFARIFKVLTSLNLEIVVRQRTVANRKSGW